MNKDLKKLLKELDEMKNEHTKSRMHNPDHNEFNAYMEELGLELKVKRMCMDILGVSALSREEVQLLDECLRHYWFPKGL